jgi:hypothetical protein
MGPINRWATITVPILEPALVGDIAKWAKAVRLINTKESATDLYKFHILGIVLLRDLLFYHIVSIQTFLLLVCVELLDSGL